MYNLNSEDIALIKNGLLNNEIIQLSISNVGPFIITFLRDIRLSINYKFEIYKNKVLINYGYPQPKKLNPLYEIAGKRIEKIEISDNDLSIQLSDGFNLIIYEDKEQPYESYEYWQDKEIIVV